MVFGGLLFSTMAWSATTVGSTDNTTAWWTAFSNYYTIGVNQKLTLEFKNYSDKAENFHNWLAFITTNADRGAADYSEYFVLRPDHYAWQGTKNSFEDQSWFTSLTSNYDWDTFRSEMDGSTVKLTIQRDGAKVTAHAAITAANGTERFEEFVIDCGDGTQTIRAFLSVEGGHLVIDDTKTSLTGGSTTGETVIGELDNSTAWWAAFSDYYTLQPDQTLTLEFKNYSDEAENYHNWLAFVTTNADRGAADYSEYFVLRPDHYAWQGTKNSFEDQSWFTSLTSNYDWDTFRSEMDGSTVKLTIQRDGAKVTAHAAITAANGTERFEEFVIDCGDGTQTVRVFLSVEGGHLVLDNSKTKITDATSIDGTVIGELDNSTAWWTAFSDYFTVGVNKTLTLEFKNYSDKAENYHNWLAFVTTNADRGAADYSEYFVLRPDHYAWQGAKNSFEDQSWFTSLTSNYDWDTFRSEMDGSTVKLTIQRDGAKVTAHAAITAANGTERFEEFVIDCGDGTQTVRVFLSVEGGHLVLDDTKTTIVDTPTGISRTPTVDGAAMPMYDLQGRRVAAGYRGIAIQNGQKVIVK